MNTIISQTGPCIRRTENHHPRVIVNIHPQTHHSRQTLTTQSTRNNRDRAVARLPIAFIDSSTCQKSPGVSSFAIKISCKRRMQRGLPSVTPLFPGRGAGGRYAASLRAKWQYTWNEAAGVTMRAEKGAKQIKEGKKGTLCVLPWQSWGVTVAAGEDRGCTAKR